MFPVPLWQVLPAKMPVLVQGAVQHVQKFNSGLEVQFEESEYDAQTGQTTLSGNITAKYDQTIFRCPKLVINELTHEGTATGGVIVTDPEGTLRAESLKFNWVEQTGTAEHVSLRAQNASITAETITIQPFRWEMRRATGSLSQSDNAPIRFESESVVFVPGKRGIARKVYIRIFGAKIGPIPSLSFSLNKRVKGLGIPSITNRRGKGVGITWDSAFEVGNHGAISSFWESFPKREPAFGLQYSYSPLKAESTNVILPQSDLDERYADGWFDSVSTRTPDEERDFISSPRKTFSVGTFWNQSTTARPFDKDQISKRYEALFESSGQKSGIASYNSIRFQSVRAEHTDPFIDRLVAEASILSPKYDISRSLASQLRADLFGTASKNGTFGWLRLEAGVIATPNKEFTFGLGIGLGSASGRPDFAYDGLVGNRALLARMDYKSGPYTFRYLAKYDLSRNKWYDKEYELALVARQFEPFVSYRQFPSETRIGIRFRIDNLRDRLTRRNQGR